VSDVFGLNADVYFGSPDQPLPDWRDYEEDDENEDAPQPGVKSMLGFDPAELDEADEPN
jgi:hypothetical protein